MPDEKIKTYLVRVAARNVDEAFEILGKRIFMTCEVDNDFVRSEKCTN